MKSKSHWLIFGKRCGVQQMIVTSTEIAWAGKAKVTVRLIVSWVCEWLLPRGSGIRRAGLTFHRELGRRRANSIYVFDIGTQHFTHTPGLRRAPGRTLRGVAIENFRDMAQRGIGKMFF